MNINRGELKNRARYLISTARPNVVVAGLLYIGLSLVFSFILLRLLLINFTWTGLEMYFDHIDKGNLDYAVAVMSSMLPPGYTYIMENIAYFALSLVGLGFVIFLLNTIRGKDACYGNLLDAFPFFIKVFLLNLLTGLFTVLWSLLFIFPGIIAAYRYRMSVYLLLDDPHKSVMECIRESKQMMKGHKWELFVLDLSFIGWSILLSLPLIGYFVQIWTVPYFSLTYALYYETLSGGDIYAADKADSVPPPFEY